jgi:hypothetical protein
MSDKGIVDFRPGNRGDDDGVKFVDKFAVAPKDYTEKFCTNILYWILGAYGVFTMCLLARLFLTPDLPIPDNLGTVELIEAYTKAHDLMHDKKLEEFKDHFNLILMTGLMPLVTMFCGYAFGRRSEEASSDE